MKLQKFEEGQNIVTPSPDCKPDIYIVASGKVKFSKYRYEDLYIEEKEGLTGVTDMLTHKINTRVVSPPEIFGDFSSIGNEQWNPEIYVYAFEGPADVICIDNAMLSEYYSTLVKSKDRSEFTEFLTLTIPGFSGR